MIVGVGIDMIEVDRVAEKINKDQGFRERIFSPNEIHFCESKVNSSENYAARFAAKEAFLKATGLGLGLGYNISDIEVITDTNGKPSLVLNGTFKQKATESNWNKIYVSLSHLKSIACAVVIIEQ
ncbi:MAG TPA: holo-ACP synthase [Chryseolinea sp.]